MKIVAVMTHHGTVRGIVRGMLSVEVSVSVGTLSVGKLSAGKLPAEVFVTGYPGI